MRECAVQIEEFRDEKLVQKIREGSEELRALEDKLKAAYMNKERKAQVISITSTKTAVTVSPVVDR